MSTYNKEYYEQNKERYLEANRKYLAKPDVRKRVNEYCLERYHEDPTTHKESQKKWRENNKEHRATYMREWRARKKLEKSKTITEIREANHVNV